MLNFRAITRGSRQLIDSVLDEDCALCVASSDALVCVACNDSLPRTRFACVQCALPLPQPGRCGACRTRTPAFDAAIAALEYRFPLDRLVRRFKYAGDLALGRWLAERLVERAEGGEMPSLIVAPPSTRARLRERGFNPALEIAKRVASRLDVHCSLEGLIRTRETVPQPGLGRDERRRNLEGVLATRLALEGRTVALVDDVMTTGATADAAARVLKRAGASRVVVWVVARAP
jgi:ComF family protein